MLLTVCLLLPARKTGGLSAGCGSGTERIAERQRAGSTAPMRHGSRSLPSRGVAGAHCVLTCRRAARRSRGSTGASLGGAAAGAGLGVASDIAGPGTLGVSETVGAESKKKGNKK